MPSRASVSPIASWPPQPWTWTSTKPGATERARRRPAPRRGRPRRSHSSSMTSRPPTTRSSRTSRPRSSVRPLIAGRPLDRARLVTSKSDVERVAVGRVARLRRLDPAPVVGRGSPGARRAADRRPDAAAAGRRRRSPRPPRSSRVPRRSVNPPTASASWSEPCSRSAVSTAGAQARRRGRSISRAIGSVVGEPQAADARRSARRRRGPATPPRRGSTGGCARARTRDDGVEAATAHLAGERHQPVRRGGGRRPCSRRSCRGPGCRATSPSSASRCIAFRAVIRLTPNSAWSSASDGQPVARPERRDPLAQDLLDAAVLGW